MKVLTIQQPWASLVAHGHKKIETRSWNAKYRGELLIHAGAKKIRLQDGMYDLIDHMERIGFMKDFDKLPYGAIIGKVNLVDVIPTGNIRTNYAECVFEYNLYEQAQNKNQIFMINPTEKAFGDYSPNRFGWLLSDPVLFDVPIPCKGQLSLWNFDIEPNISTQ